MPGRALIVIDMLQTYDFEDAERLRANVRGVLPAIRDLVERARGAGAPVIYVNDTFDDWRGDRRAFLEEIARGPHADRAVRPLLGARRAHPAHPGGRAARRGGPHPRRPRRRGVEDDGAQHGGRGLRRGRRAVVGACSS